MTNSVSEPGSPSLAPGEAQDTASSAGCEQARNPLAPAVPSVVPTNPVLLQAFAWDLTADSSHWRLLADNAQLLADAGVTSVWLPPAYKGQGGVEDVGYGVYDRYDLGEFDQKGSVPTKYGTKDEYLAAVSALHRAGISVLADVVLNHMMGGDESETVRATEVDPCNRNHRLGEPHEITAWTRYTFPGRAGAYSDFTWDASCFRGADWDQDTQRSALWLFEGKEWATQVSNEYGNYDYLMGTDVDTSEPEVAAELARWGEWFVRTTGVDGLRLDAVKHIDRGFLTRWLPALRQAACRPLPTVGEYWSGDLGELQAYLGEQPVMSLFDVPLHFHLHAASCSDGQVDLSRLFEGTLVGTDPQHAVTFVENHDTQPRQSLASPVESWFKPSAYALILLRAQGLPCVFWGDLFGTPETGDLPAVVELPLLLAVRRTLAHGPQHDFLDSPDVIGFTREGDAAHPGSGLAVLLSDRRHATKWMEVGAAHAGEEWICVLGGHGTVVVNQDGWLEATVGDGGLSVYVPAAAEPVLEREGRRLLRQR